MAEKNFEDGVSAETSHFGHFATNVIRFSLNYLARFGIAGVVVYSCWIAFYNYNYWFTWHVVLCTFGYIPLMAESVMLFLGDELWSRQMTRTAKYTIHGIIVSLATALIICGDSMVFHYIEPGYHLYTAHGITGLISLIFLLISIPVGLVIKYHREVNPYLPFRLIWYKAIHNILGILGYVVGIVSLCYAFYTDWFIYYTTYESRLLALVVTILASIWTLNGAVLSLAHQIKSVFS